MLPAPNRRRARYGVLLLALIFAASVVFASLPARWLTATAAKASAASLYLAPTQTTTDAGAITQAAANTITVNSTADNSEWH